MPLVFEELKEKVFSSRFLGDDQRRLMEDGFLLLKHIEDKRLDHISDYSFLVAPFAKAYEGFLKDVFLNLGVIGEDEYFSDHFRVGKVLNPNLYKRRFSVYSRLANLGEEGKQLADQLWQAWKKGRNLIFHYFPHNLNKLSFGEAKERIKQIMKAMIAASLLLDKKREGQDN